jgi:PKD repeat protein
MKLQKTITLLLILSALALTITVTKVSAQTASITLDPSEVTLTEVNSEFTLDVMVEDVQDLWSWKVAVEWNPAYLTLVGEPVEGGFLKQGGSTLYLVGIINSAEGYIAEVSSTILGQADASGEGVLCTLTFKAIKTCIETPINIVNTTLLSSEYNAGDSSNTPISHAVQNPVATVTLVVGTAPVANAGDPQTTDEGKSITLDGSKSYPTDGSLTYAWSFTDGSSKTLNGATVSYAFDTPGVHEVTLTVENINGEQSTATVDITVNDITAPEPAIQAILRETQQTLDLTGVLPVDQWIKFSAAESYDPEDGAIAFYTWTVNGELISSGKAAETAQHKFTEAGTYTVSLTIMDNRGHNNATETIQVNVGISSSQGATQGDSSGNTDSGNSTSSDGSTTSGQSYYISQTFTLPPLAIGILATVTILTISGSVVWLRKRS